MTDADKLAFESRLSAEPDLKQEFIFHKEVINSIQQARKAELKGMLNNISVTTSTNSAFGASAKIAAALLITVAFIGGIYLITNDEPETNQQDPNEEVTVPAEVDETDEIIQEEEENEPSSDSDEIAEETTVEKNEENNSEETQVKPTTPAEIKTPNLLEEFESDNTATEINQPEIFTESENLNADNLFASSIEVVTDDSRKRYKFHYQFKNEKLHLFGSFDKGLYEILEFNKDKDRTIILYYKDNYYLIKNTQKEITPLEPIKDPSLIEKLNNLRK